MNLGKILSNIIDRKSESYQLQYGRQYDGFFTNLKEIPDISSIKVDQILLITDQSPYSLISIAYMIRLAEALGKETNVYAITEIKHTRTIKEVCKENNIFLKEIKESINLTVDNVHEFVDKNNIGLVIVSYAHKLKQAIIDRISVTVLVTSLKNL